MGPDFADWPIKVATSRPRLAGEPVPTRHGIALSHYLDAQAVHREIRPEPSQQFFARFARGFAAAITFAMRPRAAAEKRAGYTLRV